MSYAPAGCSLPLPIIDLGLAMDYACDEPVCFLTAVLETEQYSSLW